VFCDLLKREGRDFGKAFAAYTAEHKPDSDAVCRLSYENYMVMRSHVNSRIFRARKQLELWLNWLLPRQFLPLYLMMSFTTMPYSQVVRRAELQVCLGL
jgi:kynurenine 3-monooxygenase